MAAEIISFDKTKSPMLEICDAARAIMANRDKLASGRDVLIRFRDGADNPSDPANYALLAQASTFQAGGYGTANAAARAAFLELDSCVSKLTSNASVEDVYTAVNQLCAKFGIIT